jgi:predicted MFS family arabinose efflux permease
VMLTFGGAFATYTYLRPFLETYTHVSVPQLSLLLLGLGAAGFLGTYAATALVARHLQAMLRWLPLALGAITLAMLAAGHLVSGVAAAMVAWGAVNSAIPVAWFSWLTTGVKDEPEAAGGLMVAAIQLAIMAGAAFGGLLLDHFSVMATFVGAAALLVLASLAGGRGRMRAVPV